MTLFIFIAAIVTFLVGFLTVIRRIETARHDGYLKGLEDAEPYMPEIQATVQDSKGLRVFNNLQEVMDYLDSFNRQVH